MLAVITGASSGIGEVFARTLAARGYNLTLIARRADRLQAVAASLSPSSVECWDADLVNPTDLDRIAQRLIERNPDLLINNAGFGTLGLFHKTALKGQLDMHRLHVLATLTLTHSVLPGMVKRDSGGIINVSSVAAFITGPGNASYCATKSWMNAFTEGLHVELRGSDSRVKVQALCPGYTRSEFHKTMGASTAGVPEHLWLNAEDVVQASLKGLDRGKWLVVPGWQYRTLRAMQSLAPRRWIHALAARSARNFRPETFDI